MTTTMQETEQTPVETTPEPLGAESANVEGVAPTEVEAMTDDGSFDPDRVGTVESSSFLLS